MTDRKTSYSKPGLTMDKVTVISSYRYLLTVQLMTTVSLPFFKTPP